MNEYDQQKRREDNARRAREHKNRKLEQGIKQLTVMARIENHPTIKQFVKKLENKS